MTILTSNTNYKFGDLQNYPQIWKFARKTSRTQKGHYTHHFYYRKRIQVKSNRGKCHRKQGLESPRCRASGFPFWVEWCGQCLFLLTMMFNDMHGVLPTTEAHQSFSVLSFIGAQLHRHDWPSTWLTLVSSSSMCRSDNVFPEALHHKLHC